MRGLWIAKAPCCRRKQATEAPTGWIEPSNVMFRYVYRDGSNWKAFGAVVFGGSQKMRLDLAERRIREACEEGCLFIAHQVDIPELFLWLVYDLYEDDHCWHEFLGLELTTAPVTDAKRRNLRQLVQEFTRASAAGWQTFEPAERL